MLHDEDKKLVGTLKGLVPESTDTEGMLDVVLTASLSLWACAVEPSGLEGGRSRIMARQGGVAGGGYSPLPSGPRITVYTSRPLLETSMTTTSILSRPWFSTICLSWSESSIALLAFSPGQALRSFPNQYTK